MRHKEITRLGLSVLKLIPMVKNSYLLSPSLGLKKRTLIINLINENSKG